MDGSVRDQARKEYKRRWYLANRERLSLRSRQEYTKNRTAKIEYQARYRQDQADKVRECNTAYRRKKPEKNREWQTRYRSKNVEAIAERTAHYREVKGTELRMKAAQRYAADPLKYRAEVYKWRAKHPGYGAFIAQRRRARKLAADGGFTANDINHLRIIQGDMCVVCDAPFGEVAISIDHITPLSRGGSNWPTNIQLLCLRCNKCKGIKTMQEWIG